MRGPSYEVLSLLGLTYCDIGEYERALPHLQAEVGLAQLTSVAVEVCRRPAEVIAGTYSKLAEALASLGKHDEAEALCALDLH